jgi:glycosyltransferase involved in cell wall biosynthesis
MLSVVIPTRNRAALLRSALQSIQEQTLSQRHFEVLVVDNGSTDETAGVVRHYQGLSRNIRYFFDSEPGLHVGRHRGLRESRGDVLVYADDDISALPTWLEAIAENFAEASVCMVGGNNFPGFSTTPPGWLQKLWQRPFQGGHTVFQLSILELPEGKRSFSPGLVWGCNFSIRKHVLLDCGGFHPDGMPQELIRFRGDGETHVSRYVLDKGLRCVFDSRASVHHAVTSERMTMDYFRKRAFNQGISDSYSRLRNASRPLHTGLSRMPLRMARKALSALHKALFQNAELRKLDRISLEGYREGLAYHEAAYHEDPEVRSWVHRPDYF